MPSSRKKIAPDAEPRDPAPAPALAETRKSKSEARSAKASEEHSRLSLGAASDRVAATEADADVEADLDAFDGFLLYTGVAEDKAEMQRRLKEIYENFRHESSMKRLLSSFS